MLKRIAVGALIPFEILTVLIGRIFVKTIERSNENLRKNFGRKTVKMTRIKKSIRIEAPVERVWKLLTDLDRFHEWAPVRMKLTSEKQGLGATYHTTGKFLGINFKIDQRCVEWEEDSKWSYTMPFGRKEAKLSWVLNSYQSGTNLTEIFEYELPYSFPGKLIDELMFRRYIGKMMKKELEDMKSLLESNLI